MSIEATLPEAFAIGLQHLQAGRFDEAEDICRKILELQPEEANCLHLMGLVAFRRGQPERAVELLRQALIYKPGDAEAHAQLGAALHNSGDVEQARAHLEKSLELDPRQPETHRNLGTILRLQGQLDEAAKHHRQAIALDPGYLDAHSALGVVLIEQDRGEEAIEVFRRAAALRPENPETHNNLGVALVGQGRIEEAIARYEHALALRPDYADAHANYGGALLQQGRIDEAIARFQRALALDPNHVDAMVREASALGLRLEGELAWRLYQRVLDIKPDLPAMRIASCLAHIPILYRDEAEIAAARTAYQDELTRLCEDFDSGRLAGNLADAVGSNQPFYLAYQGLNDRELQSLYGGLMCRAVAASYPPAPAPAPGEKVRVGIVAGLFRHHTVWKLMIRGWLTQLDRRKFQVLGYHTAAPQDEWTVMARQLCDRFVQGPLPPARWRDEILADAPHVLIYPDIGMDPGAGHLAAQRLAPVQCMSWGHPNTSGYPTIDYFLSSELMEPPDGDQHYTEKLVRLPNLSIYYEPLVTKVVDVKRDALGLRPGRVAYWSGQSLFKYLPQYDDIYPRIACQVPEAQFLFIEFMSGHHVTDVFRARLERAFTAHGLKAADHCIFLPRLATEVFVAAIGQCDAVLDSPGWSGGNTTLEALNHGVPIVTWPGPLMRGRHTAGILRRIGVTDTIGESIDDYVVIAARLGRDADWRLRLRRDIVERRHRIYCDRECIDALEEFLLRAAEG